MTRPNYPSRRSLLMLGVLLVLAYGVASAWNLRRLVGPDGLALSSTMIEYSSSAAKCTFLISPKWTAVELPYGEHGDLDVKAAVASPFSGLGIEVATTPRGGWDLQAVVEWAASRREALDGYSEVSERTLSAAGQEGVLTEYSKMATGLSSQMIWRSSEYHCYDFHTLGFQTAYAFSFCSVARIWPAAQPLFLEVIDSIELGS